MPQSTRGYNPDNPLGRRLNLALGTDLRDPTSFLEQLATRKQQPSSFPPPGGTVVKKEPTPAPATAQTSATIPDQDPRSRAATPTVSSFSDRKAAAKSMYEAELDAFAERERQGYQVDPLSRKRALERYNNNVARAEAINERERRQQQFWDRRKADVAAKKNRKAQFAALNERADLMAEQSMQAAKPVKSIDELNAEYTRKLGQDYAAQQAHTGVMEGMVPHRGEERQDWLTKAIDRSVATLQNAAKATPTGQLSQLGEMGPPTSAQWNPQEQRIINFLGQVKDFENELKRTPGTVNYSREDYVPGHLYEQTKAEQERLARIQRETLARLRGQGRNQWSDPLGEVPKLPALDTVTSQASKAVSDRYKAMGVDPMDPGVFNKYQFDVEREIQNMSPGGQIGASRELPTGQSPSWGETALNTLAGPGGLLGAPLPADLSQREIATAPTEAARSVAQGREATAAMQEPFWTLVGGGLVPSMKGGPIPEMTAPTTRVIDNPMVQGASLPTLRGPGIVDAGKPVTIVPGREGQITDMSAPQAIPGVTPRDLPTSRGASRQGPMQPIAPAVQPETPATKALGEIAKPPVPSPVETKTTTVQANTLQAAGLTPGQKQAAIKALKAQMDSGKITKKEFDLAVSRINNLNLSPIPITPEPIAATSTPTKAAKKQEGTANPQ
jgi:hypothetical protein